MPHFIDRAKPGVIAVMRDGTRFANEGNSYHDFVQAMVAACEGRGGGLRLSRLRPSGAAQIRARLRSAFPMPLRRHLRSGYLLRGRTLGELATAAGIDPATCRRPWRRSTPSAGDGKDPAFGKGRAYNRFQGDALHGPESLHRADGGRLPTMRSRSSSATSAPTRVSRRIAMRASSMRSEADRRPLCGRQRHRQHHGRQLSGRGDHARPGAHLRLHCRLPSCRRGWFARQGMKAYLVLDLTVNDSVVSTIQLKYLLSSPNIGRLYRSRCPADDNRGQLEAERMVIIEFSEREKAEAFSGDPEIQELFELRRDDDEQTGACRRLHIEICLPCETRHQRSFTPAEDRKGQVRRRLSLQELSPTRNERFPCRLYQIRREIVSCVLYPQPLP